MSELVRIVNGEFKGFVGVTSESGLIVPGVPDFSGDVNVSSFQIPDIPDWIARKEDEEEMRKHRLGDNHEFMFGVNGIYHFTSFRNLSKIVETGLILSRNLAKEVSGFQKYGDERTSEDLNVQDKVRTTWISNNPILASFEGYKKMQDGKDSEQAFPVSIIEFDFDTAFLDSAVYFKGNANAKFVKHGKSLDFFRSLDFEKIFGGERPRFEDFETIDGFNNEEYRDRMKEYGSWKQAEIHFPIALPVNFIKTVHFRSDAEKIYALSLMPELDEHHFELKVNQCKFTNKMRLDNVVIDGVKEKNPIDEALKVHLIGNDKIEVVYNIRNYENEVPVKFYFARDDKVIKQVVFEKNNYSNKREIDVSGLEKGDCIMRIYFDNIETYRADIRIV